MLQSVEPEIGEFGDLFPRRPDPEDATRVLGSEVLRVKVMSEPTIATSHGVSLRDARHGLGHDGTGVGYQQTRQDWPSAAEAVVEVPVMRSKATPTTISNFLITARPFRNNPEPLDCVFVDALCIWSVPTKFWRRRIVLEPLGVDEATFAVYHALLSHPDSTPEHIAALVNRSVTEVRELMDKLRKLELLVPTWTNPDGEHAVHPRVGLTGLAERRRTELNKMLGELKEAEQSAEVIAEQYNELLTSRTSGDVETLKGRANASRRIEELATTAKDAFWGLVPAHFDDSVHQAERSPDFELLERGIKLRTVYLQSMTASKQALDYAATMHRLGGEVRVTPTLPMRLLILDQELAIMPMDPEDRDDKTPLTPHEAEVLRLLAGGAKDEQVARLLGISLRTARRITANLSERLDAASRFELGVAAAKRGWV